MIRFIGKPDWKPYNKKTRYTDYSQSLKQQRNKRKHHGTHNQPQIWRFHTKDATVISLAFFFFFFLASTFLPFGFFVFFIFLTREPSIVMDLGDKGVCGQGVVNKRIVDMYSLPRMQTTDPRRRQPSHSHLCGSSHLRRSCRWWRWNCVMVSHQHSYSFF
jgi:hypothetical protein